jgi:thiaminase (transcriptional activator TenA)
MSTSACERLHQETAGIWAQIHDHPFLREMAAGTLPEPAFAYYVGQNLLFLSELAKTAALGVAKAADDQTRREFSEIVGNIMNLEISKNQELLAQVTPAGTAPGPLTMAPANLAYTRHLLTVAYEGGPAEILTSFTPCSWSYGEIGRSYAGHRPVAVPAYDHWFEFFAGDEYWATLEAGKQRLDRLCAGLGEAQLQRISDIFRVSSQLEYLFWDMAYTQQAWPVS